MTNIVENWTDLIAEIHAVKVNTDEGNATLTLKVSKAQPYQQFPQLLRIGSDNMIDVKVNSDSIQNLALKKGDKLKGLVRAASGGNHFFHPDAIEKVDE